MSNRDTISDSEDARLTLGRVSQIAAPIHARLAGVPRADVRPLGSNPYLARVSVDSLWYEQLLTPEWGIAYRIIAQPEGLVVGEIRVFPAEDAWRTGRLGPGEWSGRLRGTRATVPPGGLTARLVRKIRIDQTVWYNRELLDTLKQGDGARRPPKGARTPFVDAALSRAGVRPKRMRPPVRGKRGPAGLGDDVFQQIAREYTRVITERRPEPVVKALAARLHLTEPQVRYRVGVARRRGYLKHVPIRLRRPRKSSR